MHGELFAQTAGGETSAITELALSLLAGVGSPDFQEQLARSLKRHVKVDAGLILLYRRDAAPKILFNDWCNDRGLSDIRSYLQGSYRLDPFYRLALDNGDDGLYRLNQIEPSLDRSRYYRDYYRHSGLHDEFNIFVSLDVDTKVAISLARRRSHEIFSGEDAEFLQMAAPLLGSVGATAQAYLRVPIGVAIGVVVLGETVTATAGIGLVAVIAGVIAMTLPERKKAAAEA